MDVRLTFAVDAPWGLLELEQMCRELSDLWHRSVDLMTQSSVEQSHKPIRRAEILKTAQVIYEK